jgi:hypothetical protein
MMTLGAVTFTQNPESMTYIQPEKSATAIKTYEGTAFFSWGTFQIGQEVTLKWGFCPSALYSSLLTLLGNDAAVTFDPENSHTYTVELMSLEGAYFVGSSTTTPYRKDVVLKLLILSEDT